LARPKKDRLEEELRKMGLCSFDTDSIVEFYRRKYNEYLELKKLFEEKSRVAESLVALLEELRTVLRDDNVWIVVRNILMRPGAITGEVTRGYGMDHREALSASSWLVKNGYIERGDLEFDPIRERYVRRQYPGKKLISLIKALSRAASIYEENYDELLRLQRRLAKTIEALRKTRKYAKYFRPEAMPMLEELPPIT